MKRRLIFVAAVVLAVGSVTAGIAIAARGDDEALGGKVLGKATTAALASTGGGTIVEAEAGDEGVAYEVEVRLGNGRVVEVSLDESFAVVGREADDDGATDDEGEDAGTNDD